MRKSSVGLVPEGDRGKIVAGLRGGQLRERLYDETLLSARQLQLIRACSRQITTQDKTTHQKCKRECGFQNRQQFLVLKLQCNTHFGHKKLICCYQSANDANSRSLRTKHQAYDAYLQASWGCRCAASPGGRSHTPPLGV